MSCCCRLYATSYVASSTRSPHRRPYPTQSSRPTLSASESADLGPGASTTRTSCLKAPKISRRVSWMGRCGREGIIGGSASGCLTMSRRRILPRCARQPGFQQLGRLRPTNLPAANRVLEVRARNPSELTPNQRSYPLRDSRGGKLDCRRTHPALHQYLLSMPMFLSVHRLHRSSSPDQSLRAHSLYHRAVADRHNPPSQLIPPSHFHRNHHRHRHQTNLSHPACLRPPDTGPLIRDPPLPPQTRLNRPLLSTPRRGRRQTSVFPPCLRDPPKSR